MYAMKPGSTSHGEFMTFISYRKFIHMVMIIKRIIVVVDRDNLSLLTEACEIKSNRSYIVHPRQGRNLDLH